MRFAMIVTGPAYGTQKSSSALQFARELIISGQQLISVFFYLDGIYNANKFTSPASDELDLVRSWQLIKIKYNVELHVCVAAALRRGVINSNRATKYLNIPSSNLEDGFLLSGLSVLAQALLTCDRLVQF